MKAVNKGLFGGGLVYAEGEEHNKQREALAPAFNNAAIREFTDVFYNCAYKLKLNWDNRVSITDSVLVDVEKWMNNIALDTIGITGFSYDFGSLSDTPCDIVEVFDAMGRVKVDLFTVIGIFLGSMFPTLWKHLPNDTRSQYQKFKKIMDMIGVTLIGNTRKEIAGHGRGEGRERESIMGNFLKSEAALGMSHEEVLSQMRFLLVAGYETMSISLTWALIELARNQESQAQLREELRREFPTSDPTWEQLSGSTVLRYLDAVVHENLRLHTALPVTDRVAAKEDVIPLSEPLRTSDGEFVDHIVVAAGQQIIVPTQFMNTSTAFWGEDAREFRPKRWLAEDGIPKKAQEIEGHRHLLTFISGNRMCLGRAYALVELKAILSVLVKNYVFELPDGPHTPIELCRGILLRPRTVGEKGASVTMRVRRCEG